LISFRGNYLPAMRRIPINAGPSAQSGDPNACAVWVETPLLLDDQDFERLRGGGPVVYLVRKIPEELERNTLVYVKPTSGKPLIIDGTEYQLGCQVTDVFREEGQQGYTVTLDSPVLDLAHPDPNFRVSGPMRRD